MVLPRKVGRKGKDFVLYCVKNHCKGGNDMTPARKLYLDNIRWMTVVLVVIYHVVYMFNGVQPFGVIGPFREHQLQDSRQSVFSGRRLKNSLCRAGPSSLE